MSNSGRSASILVAGALLFSCGDGGGANTTTEFIASYCSLLQPCCAMAGLKADGQQCRTLLGAFAPAGYTASAGEACLAALRAASGESDFCSGGLERADSACDKAFP